MLLSQSPLNLNHLLLYTSSQATESDPLFCHGSETVSSFNVCLGEIGQTRFSKSRAKTVDGKYKRLLKLYHRGTY